MSLLEERRVTNRKIRRNSENLMIFLNKVYNRWKNIWSSVKKSGFKLILIWILLYGFSFVFMNRVFTHDRMFFTYSFDVEKDIHCIYIVLTIMIIADLKWWSVLLILNLIWNRMKQFFVCFIAEASILHSFPIST